MFDLEYLEFKCEGESLEQIPEEVTAKTGVTFPVAHENYLDMAIVSKELKNSRHDSICRVPFCVTVEAEALGANIKLGDEKFGPRVESYAFKSLEELKKLRDIAFGRGRIAEVLKSVEVLSGSGETVALSVEGPFTIISSLIDPMIFYKEIRRDSQAAAVVMQVIENNIYRYMVEGINKGAKIISYADPVGSLDIVGPKVYREISGKVTCSILKKIGEYLDKSGTDNVIIHICGKTSTACSSMELCKATPIQFEEGVTYGQAIEDMLDCDCGMRFIGHNCIKRAPLKLKNAVVWGITLE